MYEILRAGCGLNMFLLFHAQRKVLRNHILKSTVVFIYMLLFEY